MLFQIDSNNRLTVTTSKWSPTEKEVENYIFNSASNDFVLDDHIFGEPLLIIGNQVKTQYKKIIDILAIDLAGNTVIIELKRGKGQLGVETQALQYLAHLSNYKGIEFINKFKPINRNLEDDLQGFLGDEFDIDKINNRMRIILLAQSFDPSVFSLGEWLSSQGVSFRCLEYQPIKLNQAKYISFSMVFDKSNNWQFPLRFISINRKPKIFWHNISKPDNKWWAYLVNNNQIPACWEDRRGDKGEILLKSYIKNDIIIAYASGHGALGWGVIEKQNYKLIDAKDSGNIINGCLHRLEINWQCVANNLNQALSRKFIKNNFGITHPRSTSVSINRIKSMQLIYHISTIFCPKYIEDKLALIYKSHELSEEEINQIEHFRQIVE